MTHPDYTHIEVLIDRSGSMQKLQNDVIGGFNTFLKEQKKIPGKATMSLTQFDDKYEPNYALKPLLEAAELTHETYQPRGNTALLDAVGKMIVLLGEKLAALSEGERPSKVLVVIQTDGEENSSKEFDLPQVKALIEQQEKQYAWHFLFLGAGLTVARQGATMGVNTRSVASYNSTPKGTRGAYAVASAAVSRSRVGASADLSFTEEEKEKLEKTK